MDIFWGRGNRIMNSKKDPANAKRRMVMRRMPEEQVDKGYKLGERFGGEQYPTKYQSYTTGGVIYDDFSAPEHVDQFDLYGNCK